MPAANFKAAKRDFPVATITPSKKGSDEERSSSKGSELPGDTFSLCSLARLLISARISCFVLAKLQESRERRSASSQAHCSRLFSEDPCLRIARLRTL